MMIIIIIIIIITNTNNYLKQSANVKSKPKLMSTIMLMQSQY